jgi:hypothetical protein
MFIVENAFRTSKTDFLELRPWNVRTEESTRGHALVVMLAYIIIRYLKKAWSSLINSRSQSELLKCGKVEGFSIFQQYCLRYNSFLDIYNVLSEKCSYKKIKFCLINKKLNIEAKGIICLKTKRFSW